MSLHRASLLKHHALLTFRGLFLFCQQGQHDLLLQPSRKENYNEIEKYLNSLTNFGSQNQNWIFNLGHGFLPDIDYKKVKFVVDWIKDKDWNR